MQIIRNIEIPGGRQKPVTLDIYYHSDGKSKPVVIFAHGFKGFKDWGHWDLIAREFARNGFVFIKFNFSHNGTSPKGLLDFVDLEAFGNNNFCIELDDLGSVIDYTISEQFSVAPEEVNKEQLSLIGHSRGGGIVIIKAYEDKRVKKIATWASINDFSSFWSEELKKQWQETGVLYVENARTGQQMPLYWQLYQNYQANKNRLSISTTVKNLEIPYLIVHGSKDPVVPFQFAKTMSQWNPASTFRVIEGGDHTFGGKHPWEKDGLGEKAQQVVTETVDFLRE